MPIEPDGAQSEKATTAVTRDDPARKRQSESLACVDADPGPTGTSIWDGTRMGEDDADQRYVIMKSAERSGCALMRMARGSRLEAGQAGRERAARHLAAVG